LGSTGTISVGNSATNVSTNSTAIFINGATINSSIYTGSSNNASYLGGTAAASYVQNTDSRTLSGNLTFSGLTTKSYNGGSDASLIFSGRNDKGGGGAGNYYNDFMRVVGGNGTANVWFRANYTGDLQIINGAYNALMLDITQGGILKIGGGSASLANTQNDSTVNYIQLNNNNSQIYDDGNLHIHSRGSAQAMWINTNGGGIFIGNQAVAGGSAAAVFL
jgi:hypothetical protein